MQVGLPRNQVMPQGIRGFESLPLRHSVLDVAVLRDGLGAGWKISGASAGFGAVGHPPQLVAHLVERCHGSTVLYREEILLRDKLGRIEDRRETIGGVATDYHYEYDAAGRLEQVFMNSTLQTTYGYHANGARTSKTSGSATSGTYDAQDRIQTWGALTFTHTANGERLTRTDTSTSQTTTYTYDALGNLTRAVLPGGTIDYVLDGLNRRIGKKVGGTLVKGWLYRDQLEPVAELDGSGALVSRFVYASKPHVPDYMTKGGQTYRIVTTISARCAWS
jgi:YD repeat-containing protein